ncbi:hypothetical protein [Mangrovibacterium sp.]|uniref:gliding motility lipoprotein GldB n=1 Tax=Mangrovibacterium sp. TaxID=1961364 RepID=UPI0035691047
MKNIVTLLAFVLLLISCQRNPLKVDLSNTKIDFRFHDFGNDLFEIKDGFESELSELEKDYPEILPLFTAEIINIGIPGEEGFNDLLLTFLNDSLINEVKAEVDKNIDRHLIREGLAESFRYFHYYFPDRIIPDVFTCVSGFNQSIVMTENLLGVGLDKYLGRDCSYYPRLGIPNYQQLNMYPEKIISDAMYAWGMTEFPFDGYGPHLIDRMIYEGKLLYLLDATLPDTPDTLKIGYTKKQMEFCVEKESAMWTYFVEYKMLFSTERMDIKRYVDDAPYTSSFTDQSPGRTGAWIGWQIVKAYMKNNPEVSLPELMTDKNCKNILNQSAYQPD